METGHASKRFLLAEPRRVLASLGQTGWPK